MPCGRPFSINESSERLKRRREGPCSGPPGQEGKVTWGSSCVAGVLIPWNCAVVSLRGIDCGTNGTPAPGNGMLAGTDDPGEGALGDFRVSGAELCQSWFLPAQLQGRLWAAGLRPGMLHSI